MSQRWAECLAFDCDAPAHDATNTNNKSSIGPDDCSFFRFQTRTRKFFASDLRERLCPVACVSQEQQQSWWRMLTGRHNRHQRQRMDRVLSSTFRSIIHNDLSSLITSGDTKRAWLSSGEPRRRSAIVGRLGRDRRLLSRFIVVRWAGVKLLNWPPTPNVAWCYPLKPLHNMESTYRHERSDSAPIQQACSASRPLSLFVNSLLQLKRWHLTTLNL